MITQKAQSSRRRSYWRSVSLRGRRDEVHGGKHRIWRDDYYSVIYRYQELNPVLSGIIENNSRGYVAYAGLCSLYSSRTCTQILPV